MSQAENATGIAPVSCLFFSDLVKQLAREATPTIVADARIASVRLALADLALPDA
jgi:hypothetical protein